MISHIKHSGTEFISYSFSTIVLFFRVSTKRNNNSYVNYFLRVGRSMQSRDKREVWISCNVVVVVVIRTAATHSDKQTLANKDRWFSRKKNCESCLCFLLHL